MWLSDAMRIGCAMKPQAFGSYFRDGGSCAMGAAHDGFQSSGIVPDKFYREKPWDIEKCPECGHSSEERCVDIWNQTAIIPHLNDFHLISREKIADYVESWEVKYEGREARQPRQVKPDPLADIFPPVKAELVGVNSQ